MLPSDHFVRWYNELFKILDEMGEEHLRSYWTAIAELQDKILGPYIDKSGLRGMYEYWDKIRIEENADMDLELSNDRLVLKMNVCPSLGKNLDNDAGPSPRYCDHCAGWIKPVVEKHGFFVAYDIISRSEPRCILQIFKDKSKAGAAESAAVLPAKPYENS
jgi:hypothetical protein